MKHLKDRNSFINENDSTLKRSVSGMNKFGMDSEYGNWVVLKIKISTIRFQISPYPTDIKPFKSKQECLDYIKNETIDDIDSLRTEADYWYSYNGVRFSIRNLNEFSNIDIRDDSIIGSPGSKVKVSNELFYIEDIHLNVINLIKFFDNEKDMNDYFGNINHSLKTITRNKLNFNF